MPFLDNFSAILLDMNGTFMFGHDRFGPEEDYYATYCVMGGCALVSCLRSNMTAHLP